MCTALLLNEIYLPMKFHVDALHSFKVMLRAKKGRTEGLTHGRTDRQMDGRVHYCMTPFRGIKTLNIMRYLFYSFIFKQKLLITVAFTVQLKFTHFFNKKQTTLLHLLDRKKYCCIYRTEKTLLHLPNIVAFTGQKNHCYIYLTKILLLHLPDRQFFAFTKHCCIY